MIEMIKWFIFFLGSIGIFWFSRTSIRDPKTHGFSRFFSWEIILVLFLWNVDEWFANPFSFRQLISWGLLTISLVFIISGVRMFKKYGYIDKNREDHSLVGIEKTSQLVTTGIYHYIRHPFYSSLLFLGWGIFLKNISWIGFLLVFVNTVLLVITAKKEEVENSRFFGELYLDYMQETKRFVPFLF